MNVAIVGTGVIGTGVGLTLRRNGHSVRVHNRSVERTLPLQEAGAVVCETPALAVRGTSHVVLALWDEAALQSALEGADGVLAGLVPGQIVIDTSTQLPQTAQRVAKLVSERGAVFVDAPVHGSRAEAHAGGLWIMVGADAAGWQGALPLLNEIGATVHHMGPVGAGCAAKLCGNHLVSAVLAALAESLAMGRKSGLDCHELIKLWGESDFRSPIIEGAGRAMLEGDHTVSFHLRTMVKDTELIRNHSEAVGVPVLLSNTVHELNKVAQNLGWGELNATAIFKLFELMGGLPAAGSASAGASPA